MALSSKYGMLMTLPLVQAWMDLGGSRICWLRLGYSMDTFQKAPRHMLAKPLHVEAPRRYFTSFGTGIVISTDRAVGTFSFTHQYAERKMKWKIAANLQRLNHIEHMLPSLMGYFQN